ncbi:MAG: hypothetical protein IJQ60_14465 [Prevotella sp.]|nr:hypothetical protein [Prevotella sp.]MBR0265070.1 hypothetical protein [Prevotella sp.]
MKRLSLAIFFACCMLAVAAQEDGFRVNYQGAKPTIKDFSKAYISSLLNPEDEEPEGDGLYMYESIQKAMVCQEKGQPLEKDKTLTIDLKNGFLVYEEKDDYYVNRIEMCYWNEADGKHKLFACSRWSFENGKAILGQYDGLSFYRYDNATKKMSRCNTPGFDVEYLNKSYALPRTGKDITVTTWEDNGKKTQKMLKWNGHRFSY